MRTDPEMFNLLQLKHCLHLEILGMRHSQGSAYATIKRRFGFKGNKQRVYDQFCKFVREETDKRERSLGNVEGAGGDQGGTEGDPANGVSHRDGWRGTQPGE